METSINEIEKEQAIEKAAKLDNSALFDVHRWSDYPEVNDAVAHLHTLLSTNKEFKGHTKNLKKHIKTVLLDLYVKWVTDPTMYSSFSRRKGHYTALDNRYNKLFIKYDNMVKVVDNFESEGYLEFVTGVFDRTGRRRSYVSRMRATDKLIKLIKDDFKVTPEMIEIAPDTECIILRDYDPKNKKQRDIPYSDNAITQKMRSDLTAYNNLLRRTYIDIPSGPEDGIPSKEGKKVVKIHQHDKFVRRIFSNGVFGEGGRYYGGWWQRIPSDWRSEIRIGDTPISELDYSGLHIIILYAMEGIDYWSARKSDPYTITGFESSERMRSIFKQVLLVLLNTTNKTSAVKAMRWEVNQNQDEYRWVTEEGLDFNIIVDEFLAMHAPIAKHFYSNIGVKLQNLDSIIATKIINQLTKEDIPVLCIHDSYVVTGDQVVHLMELMDEMFKETLTEQGVRGTIVAETKAMGFAPGQWEIEMTDPVSSYIKNLIENVQYDYPEWYSRFMKFKGRKLEAEYYKT